MVCLTFKKNDTNTISETLKVLGKENLALIIHGSSFPAKDGEDTGFGSFNSESGHALIDYASKIFNAIQLGPAGKTKASDSSPYCGTIFSGNPLFIDLKGYISLSEYRHLEENTSLSYSEYKKLKMKYLYDVYKSIDFSRQVREFINENDWVKIWKAEKKLKNTEIYIDDNAMNTPAQVLAKCRKIKREKAGLDLIVIDYLGLMKSDEKTDNRQNEVASISRQMKILAKELQVPVICLCQLNRSVESRQ